jgi:hypothetical protein
MVPPHYARSKRLGNFFQYEFLRANFCEGSPLPQHRFSPNSSPGCRRAEHGPAHLGLELALVAHGHRRPHASPAGVRPQGVRGASASSHPDDSEGRLGRFPGGRMRHAAGGLVDRAARPAIADGVWGVAGFVGLTFASIGGMVGT